MTGKTFDIIAFHTVVVKNARISYDVAVAKLSESETEVPTLLVAYSYIDDGDMSMSSVNVQFKSYQIKGNKLLELSISVLNFAIKFSSGEPFGLSLTVGQIPSISVNQDVVIISFNYGFIGSIATFMLTATNGELDRHTWLIDDEPYSSALILSYQTTILPQSNMIAILVNYVNSVNLSVPYKQDLYILKVRDNQTIDRKLIQSWENNFCYAFVNSGNFVGLDVYLAPATNFQASQTRNILTFLEAPPYHDKFASAYNGNPSVTWSHEVSKSSMVTIKSTSSWTTSNTFKASLDLLGIFSESTEIENQIQNTVEEEYQSHVTITYNRKVETVFDELLIVRRILYNVTEIPVYIGKRLSGHILVVQPLDHSSNDILVTGGSRLYFNATHVIGDVRTYPWHPPTNMNYSIFTDADTVQVGNSYDFIVTSQIMKGHEEALTHEQTTKVETDVDLNFPFEIEGISGSLGFSASHSDSYQNTQVITSQTQLTTTLEISLSVPGYIVQSGSKVVEYDVHPYIFWDSSGRLHISWSVTLPHLDWNNTIMHPDPALRIPYMSSSFNGLVVQNLIFDLYMTPRGIPEDKSSTIISVKIFNYSYKPALGTTIEYYWTDTSAIPPNLRSSSNWKAIGKKTVDTIDGFSEHSNFISWFPEHGLKSAIIIVKLVSSGPDYDLSNNIGYSVWPQDSRNPLRLNYLLGKIGFFDNKHNDKLFDIGAVASDVLNKNCVGKHMGRYIHKKSCFNKGGHCCASNPDGTGKVNEADGSNGYCGYCYTSGPHFEASDMACDEDPYGECYLINTLNTYNALYSQCFGRKIGRFTHMHNRFQRGGRCCASDNDGTGTVQCCGGSQNYCGYCFTGIPQNSISDGDDKEYSEVGDYDVSEEDFNAFYSRCTGRKIGGRFVHMHNCFLRGGRCCASSNDGTGTVQRCDQSQKKCGYCFTGKPQSLMLDGDEQVYSDVDNEESYEDFNALYSQCSGRKIRGRFTHMHNCFLKGGRCCASGNDGTGTVQRCNQSQKRCGYCFTGKPQSSMSDGDEEEHCDLDNEMSDEHFNALYSQCSGSKIRGRFTHMHNCFLKGGRCCASNNDGTGTVQRCDQSQKRCGYCFTGKPQSSMLDALYSQCSGRKFGGRFTHMHNCFLKGGRCCASNNDGTGMVQRCDKSQKKCGYCFTGKPQSSMLDGDEKEYSDMDNDEDFNALYSQCSGSKIKGRFTHMHNCFLKGGRCCASNNDGTGTVQRCDQSQKRCGYCFTGKPQSSMLDDDEEEYSDMDNAYEDFNTLYSQCSGRKIGGHFTHMHNCFLKGGRCCASSNDGTGTVQRCDKSQKKCGHCFTGKPRSSMLDGDEKEYSDMDNDEDFNALYSQCSGRKIGGRFTHMHNCFVKGGRCCASNNDGAGTVQRCDQSQKKCGYCFTGKPRSSTLDGDDILHATEVVKEVAGSNNAISNLFNFVHNVLAVLGAILLGISSLYTHRYFKGGVCWSKTLLNDKIVIITGANSGIGFETAVELAKRKAKVIIACRSQENGEKAAVEVRKRSGNNNIIFRMLDLASLDSIRKFAAKIIEEEAKVDILINNAGVLAGGRRLTTKDGFELQYGVNYLGHFLLTNLLLDHLKKAPSARVVNLSCSIQFFGKIDFDNLNSEHSYSVWTSYMQSKLANIIFTRSLAKRLEGTNVTANAVDPGVVRTNLLSHMFLLNILIHLATFFVKSPMQGSQSSIHCAVCEEVEEVNGQFIVDCKVRSPNPQALDDNVCKKLWQESAKMVGFEA